LIFSDLTEMVDIRGNREKIMQKSYKNSKNLLKISQKLKSPK